MFLHPDGNNPEGKEKLIMQEEKAFYTNVKPRARDNPSVQPRA